MKIAGQEAVSQITVININLFPTSRLSYSYCIIKLSSGRDIETGSMRDRRLERESEKER